MRQNRKEHDLGEAFGEEEEYPSLEDITVEGVPFVRSLITDLGELGLANYDSGLLMMQQPSIFSCIKVPTEST